MSVITFSNRDVKETGQTYTVAAIASQLAINHNYKILMISTDFKDETLERCFFPPKKVQQIVQNNPYLQTRTGMANDVSNGFEGLLRAFQSNRASVESIKSYTKPILRDRLDLLPAPGTPDIKEYNNLATHFSQIAEVASKAYDVVIVDMSYDTPIEAQEKLYNISSIVVMGITQNQIALDNFLKLKETNPFFAKDNVMICMGRYNPQSRFSAKNVSRYLRERNLPLVVPYNILFSDFCAEGKAIDYLTDMMKVTNKDDENYQFLKMLNQTAEALDYKRQQIELGM